MDNLCVIPAKKKHLVSVHNLIQDCILRNYRANQTPGVINYYLDYHSIQRISERLANTIILVRKDEVVASGSLEGNYVNAVMVRPGEQGKGLGRLLMVSLIDMARKRSLVQLKLDAVPGTPEFYRKFGFMGKKEHWMFVPGGERLFYTPMWKDL